MSEYQYGLFSHWFLQRNLVELSEFDVVILLSGNVPDDVRAEDPAVYPPQRANRFP